MPDKNTAIVDTSVLIAFEKLNLLDKLCSVYDEIKLPQTVYHEYSSQINQCFLLVNSPPELAHFLIYNSGLGPGEAEVISLGYSSGTRVLIDDLKARKIAFELGCILSGTIGVLCKMQKMHIIDSAYNEARKLKTSGFHLSENIINKLINL